MNFDALTACTIWERGERPSVRPTIIEVAWELFRERWARRGCHHRRHNRCHRQQQDHAPQRVARHCLLLSRHVLLPLLKSRSLFLYLRYYLCSGLPARLALISFRVPCFTFTTP